MSDIFALEFVVFNAVVLAFINLVLTIYLLLKDYLPPIHDRFEKVNYHSMEHQRMLIYLMMNPMWG